MKAAASARHPRRERRGWVGRGIRAEGEPELDFEVAGDELRISVEAPVEAA